MAQQSQIVEQSDFSAGELIENMKRRDMQPITRAGARQCRNWRIEAPGDLVPRPGRRVLYPIAGRTETILLPGDMRYRVTFGNGTITVHNAQNVQVATNSGYPWTLTTVQQISFCIVNFDVFICFPGSIPQIARGSTAGTWTFFPFAYLTGSQGELRAPFYRFPETVGYTMQPSAYSGNITVTFSGPVLAPGSVGTSFRYKGYQILITGYTSPTSGTARVVQVLPPAQVLTLASVSGFYVGQVVSGQTSGATGEVTQVNGGTNQVTVQLKSLFTGFVASETVVSPVSSSTISGSGGISSTSVQASVDWDEQAASSYRGWPQACLFDRSRVALFNLPQLPEGIIWSAVESYGDFYTGPNASDSMFELVPGRKHVLFMLGGPDQFIFTDAGIYYIPISEGNPLSPGNVQFIRISPDGCGTVQPVSTSDGILFLNDGLSRVVAIIQTGAVTRPYMPQDTTEFCSHLFISPICMAVTTGASDFPEHYVYVVNSDGSMAVGRLTSNEGLGEQKWVGWTPWSGNGLVTWASALTSEMIYNVNYDWATTVSMVEVQDNSQLMDGVVTLNSITSTLAPPTGKGPLWFWAGGTVDLNDTGRDLGTRSIDSNGNLIELLNDDFSSATILAGQAFVGTFEPFVPQAQEGPDRRQTLRRRRLLDAAVAVQHSVGFDWGNRTIPAYNWGDEGGNPSIQQENTYRFRNLGRQFDPRAVLTKSRPGTLTIVEVSLEVTV